MIIFMSAESNLQLKRFDETGVETAPTYTERGQKVMEHMRCLCSSIRSFLQQHFYILRKAALHYYILSYLNRETRVNYWYVCHRVNLVTNMTNYCCHFSRIRTFIISLLIQKWDQYSCSAGVSGLWVNVILIEDANGNVLGLSQPGVENNHWVFHGRKSSAGVSAGGCPWYEFKFWHEVRKGMLAGKNMIFWYDQDMKCMKKWPLHRWCRIPSESLST